MTGEITVSVRLDDDVALKLAMFAHEARVTLNELVVGILEARLRQRRVTRSRNAREGKYVGKFRGRHLRHHKSKEPYRG